MVVRLHGMQNQVHSLRGVRCIQHYEDVGPSMYIIVVAILMQSVYELFTYTNFIRSLLRFAVFLNDLTDRGNTRDRV